jgi:hypothetical protein
MVVWGWVSLYPKSGLSGYWSESEPSKNSVSEASLERRPPCCCLCYVALGNSRFFSVENLTWSQGTQHAPRRLGSVTRTLRGALALNGSTTHKSALSFACPEHKCTNCKGTLEPKGHNRNDCPRMQTTMCEECGETGHSANKCPRMQGCNECGSTSRSCCTTHKSALSFACPEHKCTNCEGTLEPKGHNRNDCPRMQTTMCEECGETGHSATNARFVRAMHVVFEVTNCKRAICVQNTCALYVTAKNCQKVTTTIYAHVQCSQNPKAQCRRTLQKLRSKQSLFAPMALSVQSLAGICSR